jgi:hypothetical protein
MPNTHSLENTVPANDRNVLEWTFTGFGLLAELLAEIAQEPCPGCARDKALLGLLALDDAIDKLADYLDGAEATLPASYEADISEEAPVTEDLIEDDWVHSVHRTPEEVQSFHGERVEARQAERNEVQG